MVSSPCINVCVLDDGVCTACNRTTEDISRWGAMSEAERKTRMAELGEPADATAPADPPSKSQPETPTE